MKSNVNKLMIMVWCFCLASFAFADGNKDLNDPENRPTKTKLSLLRLNRS